MNAIVPFSVKLMWGEVYGGELFVSDLSAYWVAAPVEPTPVVDIVPDNLTGAEVPVTETAEARFAAAMAERAARE